MKNIQIEELEIGYRINLNNEPVFEGEGQDIVNSNDMVDFLEALGFEVEMIESNWINT